MRVESAKSDLIRFFTGVLVALILENGDNLQIGRFKVHLSAADSRLTLATLFEIWSVASARTGRLSSPLEGGKSCPILVQCKCNKMLDGKLTHCCLICGGKLTASNNGANLMLTCQSQLASFISVYLADGGFHQQ